MNTKDTEVIEEEIDNFDDIDEKIDTSNPNAIPQGYGMY